jgi:hypothetical protein
VQRSEDRVAERDGWPNRKFFQKEPAKPTPDMLDRWKTNLKAQGRITPAENPHPQVDHAAEQSKGDRAQPMRPFAPAPDRWAEQAKADRTAKQDTPTQEQDLERDR